jgi:hypothetical protein
MPTETAKDVTQENEGRNLMNAMGCLLVIEIELQNSLLLKLGVQIIGNVCDVQDLPCQFDIRKLTSSHQSSKATLMASSRRG